jgi:hypothetical protein
VALQGQPGIADQTKSAPARQGSIFYLTNSDRCDTLFLVAIRRFNRVSQAGHGGPKVRIEDAPRRPKEAKTSCAKYASRGTNPECPLESIKRYFKEEISERLGMAWNLCKVRLSRNEAGISFRINKGISKQPESRRQAINSRSEPRNLKYLKVMV